MSPRVSINMYQQARLQASNSSPNLRADPKRDTLVDLMHSLRSELAQHRYLMLDIQSRLSCLERETFGRDNVGTEEKHFTPPRSNRTTLTRPESQITQNWWKTCQKFAQRSGTPVSIEQFLGRSGCFSGFDFDFDVRHSQLSNLTFTPKAIEAPQSSPASPPYEESVIESPEYHQIAFNHTGLRRRSTADILSQSGQDIINQVIEVNTKQMPFIPLIQEPPNDRRSGSSRASNYTDMTALPPIPAQHQHEAPSHSGLKGLKEKLKCKMSFRSATAYRSRTALH